MNGSSDRTIARRGMIRTTLIAAAALAGASVLPAASAQVPVMPSGPVVINIVDVAGISR